MDPRPSGFFRAADYSGAVEFTQQPVQQNHGNSCRIILGSQRHRGENHAPQNGVRSRLADDLADDLRRHSPDCFFFNGAIPADPMDELFCRSADLQLCGEQFTRRPVVVLYFT